jgi:tetratricopeptide (TPR) repeat protein
VDEQAAPPALEPAPPPPRASRPAIPIAEAGVRGEAPPAPQTGDVAGTAVDAQLETLIVEAEVFAKYGLTDKAIERLFSLTSRRPDLFKARERLVELLAETENPGIAREVESLASAYAAAGRPADAERVRSLLSGAPRPASPPAAPDAEVVFEEFEIDQPASAAETPRVLPPPPPDAIDLGEAELSGPPPAFQRLSTPEPVAPHDTEFVSYEQLGNLLEDEMHRAEETPPASAEQAEIPVVDEANLFADEQKFFNLAEELEKELSDEASSAENAEVSAPQGEVSLEEIFREFKKGVEQQLSAEDYETHYNLGIAYKEMGLVDEAIGEFQLASKDPQRAIECCSMLGHCFLEKGMPQLAIKWFRKGLETPHIHEAATAGMLYDLASVYQDTGDTELAYKTFQEVYGLNANYRDVVRRVKDLEAVRKNS